MKPYYEVLYTGNYPGTEIELDERVIYHLAGQAAAIILGNKQKQLPAVHFDIQINQEIQYKPQLGRMTQTYDRDTAKIVGGRLIQSLPISFAESTYSLSWFDQAEYRCAFEADVSNLLAGPLAEAKYIALRDGEDFNANLVNLRALHNYGGNSYLELINEYMECLMANKAERKQKLDELFLAAFHFVNSSSNWRKISILAKFIQDQSSGIIHCEDVISLLDNLRESLPCQ